MASRPAGGRPPRPLAPPPRERGRRLGTGHVARHAARHAGPRSSRQRGRTPAIAAVAAVALIGLGLTGPAVPRSDAPLLAQSNAILIALDLSPSVAEGPALADAKAAAASVLASANGRPVGLVLYAGEAYEIAAPTADPAVLQSDIAVLGPDTMPGEGAGRPPPSLSPARCWAGPRTPTSC